MTDSSTDACGDNQVCEYIASTAPSQLLLADKHMDGALTAEDS